MDAVTRQTTIAIPRCLGLCKVVNMPRKIDDRLDATCSRLRNDLVTIYVEFGRIKMTVTVDPH